MMMKINMIVDFLQPVFINEAQVRGNMLITPKLKSFQANKNTIH